MLRMGDFFSIFSYLGSEYDTELLHDYPKLRSESVVSVSFLDSDHSIEYSRKFYFDIRVPTTNYFIVNFLTFFVLYLVILLREHNELY